MSRSIRRSWHALVFLSEFLEKARQEKHGQLRNVGPGAGAMAARHRKRSGGNKGRSGNPCLDRTLGDFRFVAAITERTFTGRLLPTGSNSRS